MVFAERRKSAWAIFIQEMVVEDEIGHKILRKHISDKRLWRLPSKKTGLVNAGGEQLKLEPSVQEGEIQGFSANTAGPRHLTNPWKTPFHVHI